MNGFIDSSGLGPKQVEAPAKRQPFRVRGPGGGGKLWPALIAGGMGAVTMALLGIGSVDPQTTQPTVTLTIAEAECVRNMASCYPVDAIPQFKEELRKAIAAQPVEAATGGAAGRSVILPADGGLIRQRIDPDAAGH